MPINLDWRLQSIYIHTQRMISSSLLGILAILDTSRIVFYARYTSLIYILTQLTMAM
jgi:hypothetical protein